MNKEHKPKASQLMVFLMELLICIFIIMSTTSYMKLQLNLFTLTSDMANLEYLSSGTQRLMKTRISYGEIDVLFSFLDLEHARLLDSTSDDALHLLFQEEYQENTEALRLSWEEIRTYSQSDEYEAELLQLISNNHYFMVSQLTSALENQQNETQWIMFQLLNLVHFLLFLFGIIICYHFRKMQLIQRKNKAIAELSVIDVTTGLYNRSKCQELFHKIRTSSKTNAVIVFDLNDLKKVNDSKGHRMGDSMIRSFAECLTATMAEFPLAFFAGRYGGDEFIVCFEGFESYHYVQQFIQKMQEKTNKFSETETEYSLNYAVGFSYGEKGISLSFQQLFDAADEKMYENKELSKKGLTPSLEGRAFTAVDAGEETNQNADVNLETTTFSIQQKTEKGLRNNKKLATFAIITSFLGMYYLTDHYMKNMDYVDGNILYLPLISTTDAEYDTMRLSSPWKNSSFVNMLLYRGLLQTDSTLTEISPDLTSGYTMSEDGLTYELTLKSGLKWSDGSEITMEDVVFSLETFVKLHDSNHYILEGFQFIEGYEDYLSGKTSNISGITTDGNKITFQLRKQYGNFALCLSQFVPLPKSHLEQIFTQILADPNPQKRISGDVDFFLSPVTSGMYLVEGENVLKRNPFYEGEISEIEEIVLVPDYSHLDIDFFSTNNINDMVYYRAIRGFSEYSVDQYTYRYIAFNVMGEEGVEEYNPMSDLNVREALILGIDRAELLRTVYYDTGNLVASGVIDHDRGNVVNVQYDPEKARSMLEESGYDFDRPIRIMYSGEQDSFLLLLQKIAAYYEEIGLKVEIIQAKSYEEMYDQRPYDILVKGLSAYDYIDWYLEFTTSDEEMYKIFGLDSYDPWVDSLRESKTEEHRMNIVDELTTFSMAYKYKIPLCTLNQTVYINSKRIVIPNDMVFANGMYRYDTRFDEWKILRQ